MLRIDGLTVRFGGLTAVSQVSLTVGDGEIVGLIGPNGAGKSTVFNCLSRFVAPTSGRIDWNGRDLLALPAHGVVRAGIARTFQNLQLFAGMTVLENVMTFQHHRARSSLWAAPFRPAATRREEGDLRREALAVLDRFGLAALADRTVADLPFGTLKLVEMARVVAARPRLLLLDEPVAGLNPVEVDNLTASLQKLHDHLGCAILVVEHNVPFVTHLAQRIVVLNFGTVIAAGTPAEIQRHPAVIEAYLGSEQAG